MVGASPGARSLTLSREGYVAHGPSVPVEVSSFKTEKLTLTITGKPVEFVPEVMGAGGQISLSIMGLAATRHGSISWFANRHRRNGNGVGPTA